MAKTDAIGTVMGMAGFLQPDEVYQNLLLRCLSNYSRSPASSKHLNQSRKELCDIRYLCQLSDVS